RKDTATALRYNAQTSAAYTAIRECAKPTVAMIFGFCMGGAMAVAMACDLRFAAEGSKFGIPAARLGIIYGGDAVGQLVDLVGPAHAKDILYSARTVSDREALAMGFIQRLVPPDELEPSTYDYLRKVADNAPLSVRGAKVTIESYLLGLTEERRRKLKDLALAAFEREDYTEGPRGGAFVVMLKGIIADELRHERGRVRALLTVQARWERRNTERADRVVVPSRYSASVAGEVYGIPPEKLAVVPEPIDLAGWR